MSKDKKISTLVEFTAKWLNKMKLQYDFILSNEFVKELESQNLVIAFGQSNNCVTFMGAIQEDIELPSKSSEIGVDKNLNFVAYTYHDCFKPLKNSIKSDYSYNGEPKWYLTSNIPSKNFLIWDDTEIYCKGIVFSLDDLQ